MSAPLAVQDVALLVVQVSALVAPTVMVAGDAARFTTTVGGVAAPRSLARSTAGRVFLAGEATDAESGGTVEAALASGERAARAVVRALAE